MRKIKRRAKGSFACTWSTRVRPARRSRTHPCTTDTYAALPHTPCRAEAFDCFLSTYSTIDSLMLQRSIPNSRSQSIKK